MATKKFYFPVGHSFHSLILPVWAKLEQLNGCCGVSNVGSGIYVKKDFLQGWMKLSTIPPEYRKEVAEKWQSIMLAHDCH